MKLRAFNLDVNTGDTLVAMLNKKDADLLGINQGDRILINGKYVAVADITPSKKLVREGTIGIFDELWSEIGSKNKLVYVKISNKPKSIPIIKKKLKGEKLSRDDMYAIVKDIVEGKLTKLEMAYFVASTYMNELTISETVYLTEAIINTGNTLNLNKRIIVDKHCIGGVAGNRTTMVVVPLLAAYGLTVPKTSSRSITSPAGTADTMEVLCNVGFKINKLKKIIEKTNAFMVWGGAVNLAPADDKIIQVEHPLSLDPVGQLLASILAKKKSVGTTHLLIDIPLGKGAKIESRKKANMLKERFLKIGKRLGFKMDVVITDGKQPIGNGIGPVLEAIDVLKVLRNDGDAPKDLKNKSIYLAGRLMKLAGKKDRAKEILESGKGYEKMMEIIMAQGGKKVSPEDLMKKVGKYKYDFKAARNGKVVEIVGHEISRIAKIAGAPVDKGAGLFLNVHLGYKVRKGDVLFTIYAESREKLNYAVECANERKSVFVK